MADQTPCTIWDKRIARSGYGQVTRRRISSSPILAHRLAYCEAHGLDYENIKGLHVRHKCDNRACVNPDHLELGTHQDNMRDMVTRKRSAHSCGEDHNQHKLSAADVREIRRRYKPRSRSDNQYRLAEEFGVSQSNISMILSETTWVPPGDDTERGAGGLGSSGR